MYLPTQWAFCAISRTRRSWSLESLIYNRGQYGIIKSIPASDVFTTSILSSLLHSSQNSCKAWKSLIILKVLHWKKKITRILWQFTTIVERIEKGLDVFTSNVMNGMNSCSECYEAEWLRFHLISCVLKRLLAFIKCFHFWHERIFAIGEQMCVCTPPNLLLFQFDRSVT